MQQIKAFNGKNKLFERRKSRNIPYSLIQITVLKPFNEHILKILFLFLLLQQVVGWLVVVLLAVQWLVLLWLVVVQLYVGDGYFLKSKNEIVNLIMTLITLSYLIYFIMIFSLFLFLYSCTYFLVFLIFLQRRHLFDINSP